MSNEKIQKGKLVSSYGGIGSIIETKNNGSLIVLPFDDWPFYQQYVAILIMNHNNHHLLNVQQALLPEAQSYLLNDRRLINNVRVNGYPNIEGLIQPQAIESRPGQAIPPGKLLKAKYFPEWFYCPQGSCRKLAHINEWRGLWNQNFPNQQVFDRFPPACPNCSTSIGGNRFRRKFLEQVRFLIASLNNGEVMDLPWNLLTRANVERHGQFVEFRFPPNATPPNQTALKYHTSASSDSLYGIRIKDGDGHHRNMAEIERMQFIDENKNDNGTHNVYRVFIKNSTSLYFADTIKSIYIPKTIPRQQTVNALRSLYNQRIEEHGIVNDLQALLVDYNDMALIAGFERIDDVDLLSRLIEADFDIDRLLNYGEEQNFRKEEYDFITNHETYNQDNMVILDDFISAMINLEDDFRESTKIKGLYCIEKLKESSAIVSYRRIDNSSQGKSWYDPEVQREVVLQSHEKRVTNITRDQVLYLPAVENFGEGLFVEFNTEGHNGVDLEEAVHTYSHILMKELEFECGYTLTSLMERLYFLTDHGKYGILIYSINGSDGSYGGITSLFPDKIKDIIKNAIRRAEDCSTDPICISENGHCFSCADIPETSCEKFNNQLNRSSLLRFLNRR